MRGVFAVGLLGVVVVLAVTALRYAPPRAQGAGSAPTVFSAQRAYAVLSEMLREDQPHPVGSPLNAQVAERMVTHLAALGYLVERQTAFACGIYKTCGVVSNILARRPAEPEATRDASIVLLTAHYDSVPAGPGASDDGLGVATLLEVARALNHLPPPRNAIRLLFTDGEEAGLLGAQAFLDEHRWAAAVAAVINVEARGTSGPSMIFETGERNTARVATMARSLARPVATSAFAEAYRRLPNDTDFTVFRRRGSGGFNMANIGGVGNYHTPRDRLDAVNLRTLQHHGDNVLALVTDLGAGGDPRRTAPGDAVFFDLFAAYLVYWPASWALPLSLLLLGVALAGGYLLWRGGTLRLWCVAVVCGAWVAALGLTALLALLSQWGFSGSAALATPWPAHPWVLLCALALQGWVILHLAASAARAVLTQAELAAGIWLGWLIAGVVCAALFVGFSYLLLVPAAVALLAAAVGLWWGRQKAVLTASLLGTWSAAALLGPTLWLLYDATGFLSFLPYVMIPFLVLALLAPCWPHVAEATKVRVALALLGLAALTLATARLLPAVDAHHPGRASLVLHQDLETATARWLVSTPYSMLPPALEREGGFGPAALPFPWSPLWEEARSRPAQVDAHLGQPELFVLPADDGNRDPSATQRLHLRPRAGAIGMQLVVHQGARLTAARVAGQWVPVRAAVQDADYRVYAFVSWPEDGLVVRLDRAGRDAVDLVLLDRVPGLPPSAEPLLRARGALYVPCNSGDGTIVSRSLRVARP